MNRLVWMILFCLCGNAQAQFGTDNIIEGNGLVGSGFYIQGFNNAIGTSFELVANDSAYAVLADTDKLEFVSGNSSDKQRIRIRGVSKSDTTFHTEVIRLNGTNAVATADSFFAFVHAYIDSGGEARSKIIIRDASGDALISSIPPGHLRTYHAMDFIPENRQAYITGISGGLADSTGNLTFEARYYPDYADYRDATNGFEYIIPPFKVTTESKVFNAVLPHPLIVGERDGGFIMLYVKDDNNAGRKGFGSISGYLK